MQCARCWLSDDGFYLALVQGTGVLCIPEISIVTGSSPAKLRKNLREYDDLEFLDVADDTSIETIQEFAHFRLGYGPVWLIQRTKRFKRVLRAFGAEEIDIPVLV